MGHWFLGIRNGHSLGLAFCQELNRAALLFSQVIYVLWVFETVSFWTAWSTYRPVDFFSFLSYILHCLWVWTFSIPCYPSLFGITRNTHLIKSESFSGIPAYSSLGFSTFFSLPKVDQLYVKSSCSVNRGHWLEIYLKIFMHLMWIYKTTVYSSIWLQAWREWWESLLTGA